MDKFRDQTVCYGNLFEQYDAIIAFCQKHMFLAGNMNHIERLLQEWTDGSLGPRHPGYLQ